MGKILFSKISVDNRKIPLRIRKTIFETEKILKFSSRPPYALSSPTTTYNIFYTNLDKPSIGSGACKSGIVSLLLKDPTLTASFLSSPPSPPAHRRLNRHRLQASIRHCVHWNMKRSR